MTKKTYFIGWVRFALALPLALFMSALLLSACGERPERPLDAAAQRTIDSLEAVSARAIKVEMDSICVLRTQSDLPRMVDSIYQIRRRERDALIGSTK